MNSLKLSSQYTFHSIPEFISGANETEQYYFHPDHLGSSNYITNITGTVTQHMEYFAFGETFVEEHKNSHNSPYKYNGKELDEETGWYYYGARFYDPRTSLWLSVDPLVEKTMDAYGYCYQNPINLVDTTGMSPEWEPDYEAIKNNEIKFIAQDGDNLQTLSTQTGIPLEELQRQYGDLKFEPGKSYSFNKLEIIAKMEAFLKSEYNTNIPDWKEGSGVDPGYNCRYFAGYVQGINLDEHFTVELPEFFKKVSDDIRIGDVLTYTNSFENFYNILTFHPENKPLSVKDALIEYNSMEYGITHYSVVLLKTKDGKGIQNVINKPGVLGVRIDTLESSRAYTKEELIDFDGAYPPKMNKSVPLFTPLNNLYRK